METGAKKVTLKGAMARIEELGAAVANLTAAKEEAKAPAGPEYTNFVRGGLASEVRDFMERFIAAEVDTEIEGPFGTGLVRPETQEYTGGSFEKKVLQLGSFLKISAPVEPRGELAAIEIKIGRDPVVWRRVVRFFRGPKGIYGRYGSDKTRTNGNGN